MQSLSSLSPKHFSTFTVDEISNILDKEEIGESQALKSAVYSLSQLITDKQFQELVQKKEIEKELKDFFSNSAPVFSSGDSFFQKIKKEWKNHQQPFLYFFPNLFNLLIHTFKLLGAGTREGGLWERYLVVSIICYFFQIPYYLAKLLEPFLISSLKTYSVALVSFGLFSSFLIVYQRCLRPLPYKISYCSNLDRQQELGELPPSISRNLDQLEQALCNRDFKGVLLKGPTGEGKTCLIHHFMCSKKKLHPSLQNLRVHKLHSSEITNGLLTNEYASKMGRIREEIQGAEQQFLFVIDEFAPIANDPKILKAFKEKFVDGARPLRFIALMTEKESEQIKLSENSPDFYHNVKEITLPVMEDDEIRKLVDLKKSTTYDVPISEDVKDKIVQLSANKDYLPGVGRAKKASRLMETAIATCRVLYRHRSQKSPKKTVEDTKKMYALYQLCDKPPFPIKVDAELIQQIFNEEKG